MLRADALALHFAPTPQQTACRVGRPAASAEAREIMRRQRERYGQPGTAVAPTVPVEAPAVPVTPGPAHVQVRV